MAGVHQHGSRDARLIRRLNRFFLKADPLIALQDRLLVASIAAGEPPPGDAQLADAELQESYRKEYLAQLRRLSCPGCGEEFSHF